MTRLRSLATVAIMTCLAAGSAAPVFAQDTTPLAEVEITDHARMAAIALDSTGLPGEYRLAGEDFLAAEAVATGDVKAADLSDAGFVSQYVSTYVNPENQSRITSYVSDWGSSDAATAGFEILEDESKTHPDASLTDADAGVGETPRETTTGTYSTGGVEPEDVAVADVTFRVDRYLVGVAIETTDDTAPDKATVSTMAATLEGRATAVVGNTNPDGADLQLASRTMSLESSGSVPLQAGYLSKTEVEQLYGLQGSSLGQLTGSWNQAIGLGGDVSKPPYLGLAATQFGTPEDAAAVVSQATDLMPELQQVAPIDGVQIEGADSVAAFSYLSPATSATEADSVRVMVAVGTQVFVVDIQGVRDLAAGQQAVTGVAAAQIACLGESTCAMPELPGGLAG